MLETGRFVPATEIRTALDDALTHGNERFAALAEQLRARQISLDQWELEMRGAIKDVHLYSTAAAKGGWAQLAPADYGTIGRRVRDQYAYLERFAADIAAGYPLDGRFVQRAKLYAQSARVSYEDAVRDEMLALGMVEERNLLHPAEHCDRCIGESVRGWVPIGELLPIGERTCGVNDHCTVEYR